MVGANGNRTRSVAYQTVASYSNLLILKDRFIGPVHAVLCCLAGMFARCLSGTVLDERRCCHGYDQEYPSGPALMQPFGLRDHQWFRDVMDLEAMISDLRHELELLNHAIQSIERLTLEGRPATKTTKEHRHAGQKAATEGGS